jgi:hypothetical protein
LIPDKQSPSVFLKESRKFEFRDEMEEIGGNLVETLWFEILNDYKKKIERKFFLTKNLTKLKEILFKRNTDPCFTEHKVDL